jgi:hypothetical protein
MDNTVIFAPPYGDGRGAMWRNAISGTLLGLLMGIMNLIWFERFFGATVPLIIGLLWAGTITSAIQGSMLRKYTRPALGWIAITILGWIIAYSVIGWPATLAELLHTRHAFTPGLIGLFTSLGQRWMLHRFVGRSFYWVCISVLCWYLVFWVLAR